MAAVRATAIYARISSDVEGAGLGVQRQIQDCRALADRLGWPVAETYEDNDLSAYSGKARPAFTRMLDDIAARSRDAVIVYHVDRLTRRPIELEQFLQVLDAARVKHVRFVVGDSDIMTGDGLMVVRMLAAVAANESAAKSRRVKRKLDQVAASGMPHGGAARPFGFEADKRTVRPDEAAVIRQLARRYVAGESLRSLAAWLIEQDVPTSAGGSWRSPTVGALLRSGRISGLRDHRGQVIGKAAWPAIITAKQREQIIARMEANASTGRRAPRSYLLSGLLRCGKCGARLMSARRVESRRYVCKNGPDFRGCGRLTVVAEPLEALIAEAVLMRLSSPDLAEALAGRASLDEQSAALSEAVRADQEQLEELAALYSARKISAAEWMTARAPIQDRLEDGRRRLSRTMNTAALDGLVGLSRGVEAAWAKLNLDRQSAVVRTLLDHVVIEAGVSGARSLDLDRVRPVWAL
jgi:site-specific DNA recombinase